MNGNDVNLPRLNSAAIGKKYPSSDTTSIEQDVGEACIFRKVDIGLAPPAQHLLMMMAVLLREYEYEVCAYFGCSSYRELGTRARAQEE